MEILFRVIIFVVGINIFIIGGFQAATIKPLMVYAVLNLAAGWLCMLFAVIKYPITRKVRRNKRK